MSIVRWIASRQKIMSTKVSLMWSQLSKIMYKLFAVWIRCYRLLSVSIVADSAFRTDMHTLIRLISTKEACNRRQISNDTRSVYCNIDLSCESTRSERCHGKKDGHLGSGLENIGLH